MKNNKKKQKNCEVQKKSTQMSSRSTKKHTASTNMNTKNVLPEMITPSKRRTPNKAITVDKTNNMLPNDVHAKSESGPEYRLTPKGVLLAAIDRHYGAGEDIRKFDEFMKDLCQHLSMIATDYQHADMFGDDFNSLFDMLVSSMNLAGKMKEVLDENGIEFNVTEFLQSIGSEYNDITSDEDSNDAGEIMPRRKK